MLEAASSLHHSQAWLQAFISHPGNLVQSADKAVKQFGITSQQLIRQECGLSAHKRLAIYKRGYLLRLLECIRADFPMLRKHLGDELFDTFARAYLINNPSTSYTLFNLSKDFPDFLARTRPQHTHLSEAQTALLDLPAELARLERLQLEALRAEGTEKEENSGELEFADWRIFSGDLQLRPPPCLRLLKSLLPVVDVYTDLKNGKKIKDLKTGDYFIAVSRSNYRLQIQALDEWQFDFLQGLVEEKDFQEIIKNNIEHSELNNKADLWFWLSLATQKKLITTT